MKRLIYMAMTFMALVIVQPSVKEWLLIVMSTIFIGIPLGRMAFWKGFSIWDRIWMTMTGKKPR